MSQYKNGDSNTFGASLHIVKQQYPSLENGTKPSYAKILEI